MTWLNNPIAQMWGPYFLVLYALVFAVLFALIRWHRRRVDQSMELGDLPMPSKIDPYPIAYLRGGLSEVSRLATVDLYQRGLIAESTPDSSGAKRLHLLPEADLTDLDPLLRAVAIFYRTPHKPTELLKTGPMSGFNEKIAIWDRWIENERLHHSKSAKTSHHALQTFVLAGYLALGIYKILATPREGGIHDERYELAFAHTIEYLYSLPHAEALAAAHTMGQYHILFFGVGIGIALGLIGLNTDARLPRCTDRGRRFIDNLQTAFASLKRPQSVASATSDASQPVEETDDAVLAMGVFGVAALQGGPLDMMFEHYAKSADAGSACGGGCGSSCGSGDGGSGDGGSGCGGCGGGGCGCGG